MRFKCFISIHCFFDDYIGCFIFKNLLMNENSMNVNNDVQNLNLADYLHQNVLIKLITGFPHCENDDLIIYKNDDQFVLQIVFDDV